LLLNLHQLQLEMQGMELMELTVLLEVMEGRGQTEPLQLQLYSIQLQDFQPPHLQPELQALPVQ
jgi:hypothetical protein